VRVSTGLGHANGGQSAGASQDQAPPWQWQMGPQGSKPPQNMPSSVQQAPSTGATLGRFDGALAEEQNHEPGEPLHAQSRVGLTHCAVVGQASGSGASHPPEELEELVVAPLALLPVTLPVVLAPPAPPDPLGRSTAGPHAMSAVSSEMAALRGKGAIIQRRYTAPLEGAYHQAARCDPRQLAAPHAARRVATLRAHAAHPCGSRLGPRHGGGPALA
jgi:hypothetical protein